MECVTKKLNWGFHGRSGAISTEGCLDFVVDELANLPTESPRQIVSGDNFLWFSGLTCSSSFTGSYVKYMKGRKIILRGCMYLYAVHIKMY